MPTTPKKASDASEHRSRQATSPSSASTVEQAQPGPEERRQAQSQVRNGIGERLRARRTQAGLSLRRLARDLDVSASFLSQVENGKTQPSVATLYLICSALELSIDELFAGASGRSEDTGQEGPRNAAGQDAAGGRRPAVSAGAASAAPVSEPHAGHGAPSPVVAPAERRRLVLDSGVVWEQLSTLQAGAIDFMFVRYDVGGSSTLDERLTRHSGIEYGFVMRGRLEVTLGFETYRVGPGDAISFDSSTPHRLSNIGDEPVEAVWFVHGRNDLHHH